MFNLKSIKTQLILYLVCFAIFLAIKDKDPAFLLSSLIAIFSASTIETLILYFKTKKLQITESSIITGLIIGFVLSSDAGWWNFVFAAALAIISKYLIIFKEKHIFNPAALGIFFSVILLGASTEWRGTYLWYVLVPFGLYFTRETKKIEVVTGYAVVSLLLFGIQALLRKAPLWNISGYFSYFYIFIMVIEPKTTPVKAMPKYLFGAAVAALIFILTGAGVRFDVELFSLLALNAASPLLNKLSPGKSLPAGREGGTP